jgi:hypothetical protein
VPRLSAPRLSSVIDLPPRLSAHRMSSATDMGVKTDGVRDWLKGIQQPEDDKEPAIASVSSAGSDK